MNRQQRRKREREKRKNKKRQKSDKITPLEYQQVINSINAVKMAALLTLRNEGWGNQRLSRFSKNFNVVLKDVSDGWLSLSDISGVIEEETGLTWDELKVE